MANLNLRFKLNTALHTANKLKGCENTASTRRSNLRNRLILSLVAPLCVAMCTACGVRGPLTLTPTPIKGLDAAPKPLLTAPAPGLNTELK